MKHPVGVAVSCIVLALLAVAIFLAGGPEPAPTAPTDPMSGERAGEDDAPSARAARLPDPAAVSAPEPASAAPVSATRANLVRVVLRAGDTIVAVAGAQVRAVAPTRDWSAVTDVSGEAAFPSEAQGHHTVWVSSAAAGSKRFAAALLGMQPLVVELSAGALVRLDFRDERGDVVRSSDARSRYERAGRPLTLRLLPESAVDGGAWNDRESPLSASPAGWQLDAAVVWEDAGVTTDLRLSPGRWRLVASRPELAPFVSDAFVVRDGRDAEVTVVLPGESATRMVKLVDAASGQPLAGATVTPWFTLVKDYAHVPGSSYSAGADGTVVLPAPSGATVVPRPVWSVEAPQHAVEFDDALLGAAGPAPDQPVVVRVPGVAAIEGVAYAAPGIPASLAQVSWASRNGPSVRTSCGADGRFRLSGIRLRRGLSETASVRLATDHATRFYAVDVAADATSQVVLGPRDPASRVAAVSGRLTAGGSPLAGLQVVLAPLADPRSLAFAMTGADGGYRFDAVPEGTVKLRVICGDPRVSDAFKVASTTPVRVAAGETTTADFDLPDAAIRVIVVSAELGTPIEGARVTVTPLDPRDSATRFVGASFVPGWSAYTDAQGRALLPGVVASAPHRIEARDGRNRVGRVEDAVPGTVAVPSEVTLALRN